MQQQPNQQGYGVYIPPEQVYADVRATRDAVTELTSAVKEIAKDLEGVTALELRVRALETRLASYMQPVGAAGGLAGLASAVYALMSR